MQVADSISLNMITVAKYELLETALRDASRMTNRNIRVSIEQGIGYLLPGLGLTIELQVHPEDIDKLESLADMIPGEIAPDAFDAEGQEYFGEVGKTTRAIARLLILVMAHDSHLLFFVFWLAQKLTLLSWFP